MAQNGNMNLFDRAILHSGSVMPIMQGVDDVAYISTHIANQVNCTETPLLECLRNVPAEKLVAASMITSKAKGTVLGTAFGPFLEKGFIDQQHHINMKKGLFRKIPLMINTNMNEGSYFAGSYIANELKIALFEHRLLPFLTPNENLALQSLYPPDSTRNIKYCNASDVLGDFFFQCPSRALAQAYSSQHLPVFKSLFKRKWNVLSLVPNYGVPHGSDFLAWWQFSFVMLPWPFNKERELSRQMLDSIYAFGSADSFTQSIGRQWPRYDGGWKAGQRVDLDLPAEHLQVVPDSTWDRHCEFFNSITQDETRVIKYPEE